MDFFFDCRSAALLNKRVKSAVFLDPKTKTGTRQIVFCTGTHTQRAYMFTVSIGNLRLRVLSIRIGAGGVDEKS